MNPDDFPAPREGFVITHFLVVSDQDRSRDFYRTLFDGKVLIERDPVIMKVANTWLILNEGGGPTDDKPTVTLTTPPDPNRTSAFLNVRVADIASRTASGPRRARNFSPSPRITVARSARTSAIPTATSSRWARRQGSSTDQTRRPDDCLQAPIGCRLSFVLSEHLRVRRGHSGSG